MTVTVLSQWQLELYRHKIHNLTKPKMSTKYMSWRIYWKEHGAFISVMPRGQGKTKLLEAIAEQYIKDGEDVIVVAPNENFVKNGRFKDCEKISIFHLEGMPISKLRGKHLIVDEFKMLSIQQMYQLLSCPWKSVTMAGSL